MENESRVKLATREETDKVRGYRETRWKHPSAPKDGYPNYECVQCQYSTPFLPKMQAHIAEGNHVWAYPGQNEPNMDETLPEPEPQY